MTRANKLAAGAAALLLSGGPVFAADLAPPPPAAVPPVTGFWDTFKFNAQIDAGITGNPSNPADNLNFGRLFTDKANSPLLNQILLTAQRPLDPKATGVDFGFKLQGLYGSDARYTHFLGELDRTINDRNQIAVIEAWGVVHLPILTQGGIDIKAGQYVTLEGIETIDPSTNLFYSHSYIFNFGPFQHTGVMTITHVNPMLDIYAGVDTGLNTTFKLGVGDNNTRSPGFHGGIGLNLLDGNLTILATTHIGPENPIAPFPFTVVPPGGFSALRYYNDASITWKVNDKLTLMTDLNYIHDDGFNASAYGVAQYGSYALTDWLKLVGRAEVYRDNSGFFVAQYPGNFDAINASLGLPNTSLLAPPTTYGELTLGLNITPAVPKPIASLTFRPEVRYDTALNGTKPFGGTGPSTPGAHHDQFTFGGDIIIGF